MILLTPGELNVITGGSQTGKSALIDIIEYCLGRDSCNVPEGPIRQTVEWYGVRIVHGDGRSFIARRGPEPGQQSSTAVHYATGRDVPLPEHGDLRQNTNADTIVSILSRLAGMQGFATDPGEKTTRRSIDVNIKHTMFFLFQRQDEILNRRFMFHRQDEEFLGQTIRDVLPYLLGATDDDDYADRQRLRALRRRRTKLLKAIEEARQLTGGVSDRAYSLLTEAEHVGLVQTQESAIDALDAEAAAAVLRSVVATTQPSPTSSIGDGRYQELQDTRQELRRSYRSVQNQLDTLEAVARERAEYQSEISEQAARLRHLETALSSGETTVVCPLCEESVQSVTDAVADSVSTLAEIERHLGPSDSSSDVTAAVAELREQAAELRDQLRRNAGELTSVQAADERSSQLRDIATEQGVVLGRIGLYLETLGSDDTLQELRAELTDVDDRIVPLSARLSDEALEDRLESILSLLSSDLTRRARELDLEHAAFPLRLDLSRLTVVADTDEGPVPMDRMGSGENWVGYHLATHLALHAQFRRRDRPVPSFLFLDQPSEVYFPPDLGDDPNLSAGAQEDREAVVRMFSMLYDFVADTDLFQIILTEHADLSEDWFQESIVERWRGDDALIPASWLS